MTPLVKFLIMSTILGPLMAATPPLISLSGTPVHPNVEATLNVSLAGATGANISGVQWTVTVPPSLATRVQIGPAAAAVGKDIYCNQNGSDLICIVYGMNANVMTDGIVATIAFTPTNVGTLNFALSGTLGASAIGDAVTVGAAVPFAYAVLSECDINGDESTDVADVTSVVGMVLGRSTCTADLDKVGGCTIADLMRVVVAATGGACRVN